MNDWNPTRVTRVVKKLGTSTKPVLVDTDDGPALLKYMGNPQGNDALIAEKLAADFAVELGIPCPPYSILSITPQQISPPAIGAVAGPAFLSKWMNPATTFSPQSEMLEHLRDTDFVPRLVVFDTWIMNGDRFEPAPGGREPNYDNLLFVPDIQKVKAIVIDHTHAFVEQTFEEEVFAENWWADEEPLGLFPNFDTYLNHDAVMSQIDAINELCSERLEEVIASLPPEWHMSVAVREALFEGLKQRAQHLANWLPPALFDQTEMNYRG